MRRIFAMLAATATILITAPPASAQAGFWAVTELDPLAGTITPDVGYTIGYWVLQHGTHPFDGPGTELGTTGLRLTGKGGRTLNFTGTRLPEPAHYAVSVKIPAGTWRLEGVQGMFAPYEIGTLTVPGGLTPAPPQFPGTAGMEVTDYWGAIKPPGFPWKGRPGPALPGTGATVTAGAAPGASAPSTPGVPAAAVTHAAATQADATQAAVTHAAARQGTAPASPWFQPYLLVAVAVISVAGTLLVQRASARTGRSG
ncbi:hypothetical protein JOL79_13890 [Microbispora sp. RL4-1S]|uniref:Htaa domain-containing protein n=1 Tax=Microbispora oryzae TaxID=2806554 RepID=A0A941AJF0_9ACTN|nr:hypothetical protein [Microbispora oryzae]MBP2704907.1 hypothetical protein [Microbispora oryzae]